MKYRIVITVMEANPNYTDQLKAAQAEEARRPWNVSSVVQWPAAEIEVKKLETVLTEEEFLAIRETLLGTFALKRDAGVGGLK